jgi:DNA (cytosine-5)-methyltransferase 1
MKLGSLCSGYGGLDMAVETVFDASTAWVSDIDKGACKILAHRYPDVPNIGDMTAVDWSAVEPVDVLCGGTPCQDLSAAGKRAGMSEGTRSNLWVAMREAVATIRPTYVVWENVRGAYSAAADSAVEPCTGCVGDGSGVSLRALGRVLGDLSDLGYDTSWHGLRAADVGAPHGRFRIFVVATDTSSDGWNQGRSEPAGQLRRPDAAERGAAATDADREGRSGLGWQHPERRDADGRRGADGPRPAPEPTTLLPSPRTSDTNGAGRHGDGGLDLRTAVALLGTPRASEWKGCGPHGSKSHTHRLDRDYLDAQVIELEAQLLPTPAARDHKGRALYREGGPALTDALLLLPTPRAGDGTKGGPNQSGSSGDLMLPSAVQPNRWGKYAEAVARWETLTRPAPAPTEPGRNGPRLATAFSEWMMGLPAGWVTDVPGITRNDALRALGNGVVPQQAEAALATMLTWQVAA